MPRKPAARSRVADAKSPAVRKIIPTADGLKNVLSGLGGNADKLANTMFIAAAMDRAQLDHAYRGDWIARKGVDIPAFDACREWRSWQLDRDDITKVEEIEKRLLIQQKTMKAIRQARLYGGGALVIGVDDGQTQDKPLNLDKVNEGSLKFVHAISRFEITAGQVIDDLNDPYYGEPAYFDQTGQRGSIRFHPSRIVRFCGNEILDQTMATDGWGDSVLISVTEAILGSGLVNNSAAQLVAEAKVDVIRIPGFSEGIETQAYEDALKKRFEVASFAKSVYRTLIMDKEEEWQRIEANFAGLPDVQKLFLLIVSGAFDIPATRFLSQSPAGLSATGDSDIRNYYDRCSTVQKMDISPTLKRLDDVLLRSAGLDPDALESSYYIWNPLWQMTDSEKADVALKKAQAFQIDVNAGLINTVVLKKSRENQLIEDGTYPGFEQTLEEFDDDPDMENQEEEETDPNAVPDPAAANENDPNALVPSAKLPAKKKVGSKVADAMIKRMKDATRPRSLYVRRDVLNADEITKWAKSQGFESVITDLHVTVIYSKTPVDWIKVGEEGWGEDDKGRITIKPGGPRVIEEFGESAVVLAFSSSALQYRHGAAKEFAGCSCVFEDYTPHVTITYKKPADLDLSKVAPYAGQIVLGPEIFEEIEGPFDPAQVVEDFEPCHEPAGRPTGGQFTSCGGGSGGGGDVDDLDEIDKLPTNEDEDAEERFTDFFTKTVGYHQDKIPEDVDTVFRGYSDEYYHDINSELRGMKHDEQSELTQFDTPEERKKVVDKQVAKMDAVMNKTKTPRDVVLYRLMSSRTQKMIMGMKEGDVLRDKGFVSTSGTKEDLMNVMSRSEEHYIPILARKGSKLVPMTTMSNFPLENEYLIARNSTFVLRVDGKKRRYLELRQ